MEHGAWCLQQTGFTGLLKAGCRFDVRVRQVATRPAPVLEFLRMVICSCSNQGLFSLSLFFFLLFAQDWMKGTATTQDKTKKGTRQCMFGLGVCWYFFFCFCFCPTGQGAKELIAYRSSKWVQSRRVGISSWKMRIMRDPGWLPQASMDVHHAMLYSTVQWRPGLARGPPKPQLNIKPSSAHATCRKSGAQPTVHKAGRQAPSLVREQTTDRQPGAKRTVKS